MEESSKRQIAYKIMIGDLLKGKYVKQEGWEPNYVKIGEKEISRVNLLGVVISKSDFEGYASGNIDDSSGSILMRSFEDKTIFEKINIGDAIQVIGKVREYNNQIFVIPEIIKKVDNPAWIEVRKKELNISGPITSQPLANEEEKEDILEPQIKQVIEEQVLDEETPSPQTTSENIVEIIRKLDKGDGADHDDVLKKIGTPNAEKIVSNLLMEGEIFEVSPGMLKVLE